MMQPMMIRLLIYTTQYNITTHLIILRKIQPHRIYLTGSSHIFMCIKMWFTLFLPLFTALGCSFGVKLKNLKKLKLTSDAGNTRLSTSHR